MKVYARKEDIESNLFLFAFIFFLVLGPVLYIIHFFKNYKESLNNVIFDLGPFVISIIFIGFGLFFLLGVFAKPKRYKCILKEKTMTKYNGRDIVLMRFDIQYEENDKYSNIYNDCFCYTYESNSLEIDNEYEVLIKQINWCPKYVKEYDPNDNVQTVNNGVQIGLVKFIVLTIFGAAIISNIVLCFAFPKYSIFFIFAALPFIIAFIREINIYIKYK